MFVSSANALREYEVQIVNTRTGVVVVFAKNEEEAVLLSEKEDFEWDNEEEERIAEDISEEGREYRCDANI